MFSVEKRKVWLGSLIDLYYIICTVFNWKHLKKTIRVTNLAHQSTVHWMILIFLHEMPIRIQKKNENMWKNKSKIPLNQTTGLSRIYLISFASLTTMLRGGTSSGIFVQFSLFLCVPTIKYKTPSNPKIKRKFQFCVLCFRSSEWWKKKYVKCQTYQLSHTIPLSLHLIQPFSAAGKFGASFWIQSLNFISVRIGFWK